MTKKNKPNGKAPAPPRVKPPPIYGDGYPVDDNEIPIEDAEVPLSVARTIAMDPESARDRAEAASVMRRKANGEKNVRLPTEDRARFQVVKSLHPSSYVTFKKLEPEEDDGIPPRQLSMFPTYDALLKYLKDSHWDGRQSTYEWAIRDSQHLKWTKGLVRFAERSVAQSQEEQEDDDMARRGQPPQYAPQGYPPGYYPPPYPQHYYPPQPPPPAPIPEGFTLSPAQLMQMSMAGQQAGVPPEMLGQFLQMFERLSQNNATLAAELRQQRQPPPAPYPPPQDPSQVFMPYLMQMIDMVMKGKDPAVAPPPAPAPAPPPDPLQQMETGLGMLAKFGTLQSKLARQFAPAQPQLQENPIADTPDDDIPFILKDMGPMRAVLNKDGTPVDTLTKVVFNMDKIGGFLGSLYDQFEERRKKQQEAQQPQVIDTEGSVIQQKAAAIREVAEQTERVLAARRELAQTPAPPPPQLNPQFVRVVEQPPPPPPAPPPQPAPAVIPLALRMMVRKVAPPPVELIPEPGDFDFDPESSVQTAPSEPEPEATADTEPPPPPVVADAN